jgi:tetratricopeptide (TPR) repeat protein
MADEAPLPPPGGPAPASQPSTSRRVWATAGLVLAVMLGAWWLGVSSLLARLQRLQGEAVRGAHYQQHVKALEMERDTLLRRQREMNVDRENLLAQVRMAQEARTEAEGLRNLLESRLRRTAEESQALSARLGPLEPEVAALRSEVQRLAEERQTLEGQIEKFRKRSRERQLRDDLKAQQAKLKATEASLAKASRALEQAEQQAAQMAKARQVLQGRLDQLQQEYAAEVSHNATLRRETERLPKDITGIAREHARLVKELADTHFNMGVMFATRKDFVRAEKEFLQVVQLRPDDAEAHYNLGIIYAEHLPNRARAIKYFQRYLTVDPAGRDANYAKQYIATWRAWEGQERLE